MGLLHIIAARLRLLHKWNCPWNPESPPDRAFIGRYGELVAASFLRAAGAKVLRRNFKAGRRGELDLVCRHGDTLVACEVKSSAGTACGAPGRMVDAHKRRLLRWGLQNWLFLLKKDPPTRIDIVEVFLVGRRPPVVRWHKGAVSVSERPSR